MPFVIVSRPGQKHDMRYAPAMISHRPIDSSLKICRTQKRCASVNDMTEIRHIHARIACTNSFRLMLLSVTGTMAPVDGLPLAHLRR